MGRFALLGLGSALLMALDQWTKGLAVQALSLPAGTLPADAHHIHSRVAPVLGEWFRLRLTGNKGMAISLFAGLPDAWRVPVLVIPALLVLAVVIHLYLKAQSLLPRLALLLIIGGALGNLSDRLRLGYVVDFIQWEVFGRVLPTFNLADAFICLGVGLLLPAIVQRGWVLTPRPAP